jgi:hypothetical protein
MYGRAGVRKSVCAVMALVAALVGGQAHNLLHNANVLVKTVTNIVDGVVAGISSGQYDDAWNAVVDGLLGPTGLPGALVNGTIGLGNGSGKDFVPSVRTAVTKGVQDVAGALAVPVLPPVQPLASARGAAAVQSAPMVSSSVVRAAAASATEAATPSSAAEPTGTDVPSEAAASAKDTPVKHRVSRKAAADS